MPMYEFDCLTCGDEFDKLVRSANAVSEVTCPSCDSGDIKKKLSLFSSRTAGARSSRGSTSAAASCAPGGL